MTSLRGEVAALQERLDQTQEWLERFQGVAAASTLEVETLRVTLRTVRSLLVDCDSYLGLWRHRYQGVRPPDDLWEEVDELRRRLHPWVAARGRGEMVHATGPNPVDASPEGSTPSAPTGAVQVSLCPLCGSTRTMSGNVASCLSCGGYTQPATR